MDYTAYCRNYFALTNIPVALIQGETPVYSAIAEALSMEIKLSGPVFWEDGDEETNPTFCRYSPEIEYSVVHIEGTDYYVALGPVFSVPITEEIINTFMKENQVPMSLREDVSGFLHAIPLTTRQQFYRHARHLHMSLNHVDVELLDLMPDIDSQMQEKALISEQEAEAVGNTYDFEQDLYQLIKKGDVLLLNEFLQNSTAGLSEGKLASTPLRHTKNIFIQNVTKVGMFAGIPAGIDIDTVYHLTRLYIQECEKLQSLGDIQSLQYAMLKDFCGRCAEAQLPAGISNEVFRSLTYIHMHITEPISVNEVAEYIGRSSSYLSRRFKEEMGMSVSTCIMNYKLSEAQKLLTYTDKSLAEISFFFGFSSQSYFQNVFKKEFGITPMQYRKDTQKR